MAETIALLDVVAVTEEVSEKALVRGQVGTVVDVLALGVSEVEFSDNDGHTYAMASLKAPQLLVLHHQPVSA